MPHKLTLYVSDEHLPVWDRARQTADARNTSLSKLATSALTAHLHELETKRAAKANPILRAIWLQMADIAMAAADEARETESKSKAVVKSPTGKSKKKTRVSVRSPKE
jgi:hypothetical protein